MAFGIATASAPIVLRMLRGRVMDVPNARSNHEVPTPRGGGVVIILGLTVGYIAIESQEATLTIALAAALVLGVVGLAEDLRGLSIKTRLAAQLAVGLAASALILAGTELAPWQVAAGSTIGAVWLAGYTNAFNFMDGINGISAFQLMIVGGIWIAVGHLDDHNGLMGAGAITIAATAGFLPWNFPRARFFMGDVGSYFCGAWIATVTVVGVSDSVRTWPLIAAVAVYITDTSFTLITRMVRGENWTESHSTHVFQRLVAVGWSHGRTGGFYVVISLCLVAAGFLASGRLMAQLGAGAASIAILGVYLFSPALHARIHDRTLPS